MPLLPKFTYIHIKEVFHHITGASVKSSCKLLMDSLYTIKKYQANDGVVFIHEVYYESFIIPSFSRTLIFYLLKLQNKIKIKIPIKEFMLSLDVCFYTRKEFKSMLLDAGFKIIDERDYEVKNIKNKLILLKNYGAMLFILK
jgi:hypothetical protein